MRRWCTLSSISSRTAVRSLDCVCSPQSALSLVFMHPIPDHLSHVQVLASNGRGGGMYVNPLERVSSMHIKYPHHSIANVHFYICQEFSAHLYFSTGRPLSLLLHLLLSSQNPHWHEAQEVPGRKACHVAIVFIKTTQVGMFPPLYTIATCHVASHVANV